MKEGRGSPPSNVSIRPIGILCQDNERQWQPHHPKNFWKMKLSAVFWVKYFEYLKCALGDVSGFANYAGVANLGEGDFENCILTISIWIIHDGRQHHRKILMACMAWLSLRLIKLWSCGSDCPRDHSIWSVVSQKGNIFPHPGLSRGNSVTHELVSDVGYETCNYPSIFNRLQLHREHLLSKNMWYLYPTWWEAYYA